jgi:PAS domain S-box-containing protein
MLSREVTAQIKAVLEQHPEGLSITDLVKSVDINRNTAGRYLERMLLSGQVEMRRFGMAKMYTLAERLPVSSVLSISSELVLQLDFSQRIIFANDTLLTFLHAPAKALFVKNIEFTPFPVVFEEVFPELLDRFRRGLRGEEWHGELSRPVRDTFFFCRVTPTVSNEGTKSVSVFLEDISNQKRDEERIRKSEARLRSIFRASSVGIGVVADRILLEVNDRFCQMTGYPAAELVGKSVRMLYSSPEEFDRTGVLKYSQARRGGTGSIETHWVKKDGTVIDVLMSVTLLDPANISAGITFTALDITERNRAGQALRESEARLQLALSGAEMGMWELEIPSLKGSIDERAAAILGFRRNDIGTYRADWDTLSHPDDVPFIHQRLAAHLEGRAPLFESEHRMRHTSGRWIWILGRGKITSRSKEDSGIRISGTLQDITARKESEQALRESEEKYRHVVEESLQGLTILQDGRPVYANPAMLEIGGYASLDEYLALSSDETMATVHPEDRGRIAQVMADRLAGMPIPPENEFRILRKDGEIRWVMTRGARITYSGAPAVQITYFDITERKQAERSLSESEERLRQVTETLTSVFYVHDRVSNQFVYVSPAYEKIWKRSCQSLYDNPYTYRESVHPDDQPLLLESIRQEREGSKYVDTEYRIIQPDGTVRWIHSQNFPIFDAQGKVYRVAGIAEDITGRRTAEDALRESEDRYRKLVEISPNAIILHQDGKILYVNAELVRILGARDAGELTGREVLEIIHPGYLQAIRENIRRDLKGENTPVMEMQLLRTDGTPVMIEGRGVSTSIGGRPAVLVALNDITERYQAAVALKESENRYRSLAEASRDIIFVIGRDDRVDYVNSYAAAMLGMPASQLAGRERSSLFSGETGERQARGLRRVFETGKEGRSEGPMEVSGKKRWFDHYLIPITDAQGTVTSVLGVSRDITDRKIAEEAQRASEERYRFIADNSLDIITRITPENICTYVSPAITPLLGYPVAGMVDKPVLSLVHPDDLGQLHRDMEAIVRNGLNQYISVFRIRHRDGHFLWFESTTRVIRDESTGSIREFLSIARDVTGRMEAGR